ncbi:PREDICTED: uncharacterized protein LOC108614492 isoform X2 [Drosophila arizonae]|uniref:Uncharacterized protein LOC108614492 isoform X2 n=1 Tax=Drosophila arizonae TaxID=7263 RepID=A0ABM1PA99_DROAR|nr:PREDICTED: uncharacterized protein LOC108614492 isoform X2 [Drosophila arizonae]
MGESGRAQIDANRVRCARHESNVTRHNATRRDGAVQLTVPPTLVWSGLGWAVPSDGGSTPTTTTTTASSDPRADSRSQRSFPTGHQQCRRLRKGYSYSRV